MRIDRQNVTPVTDSKPRNSAAAEAQKAPSPGDPSSVVKVAATTTEKDGVDPAVAQRIERVRALLAKGAYPIDFDKLASRIVDDDRARAGGKPK